MLLTPISDFTGDGKAHSVAAIMTLKGVPLPVPPLVRAISFRVAGSGNSPTYSRIGDQTVGAACGIPFNNTDDLVLPYASGPVYGSSPVWDLTTIYIYAAAGEVLSIALVN
jgi:hypothetical protein